MYKNFSILSKMENVNGGIFFFDVFNLPFLHHKVSFVFAAIQFYYDCLICV